MSFFRLLIMVAMISAYALPVMAQNEVSVSNAGEYAVPVAKRGDLNEDGDVNVSDIVVLVKHHHDPTC